MFKSAREIDLRSRGNHWPVYISGVLEATYKKKLVNLLVEFNDYFTQNYDEMSRVDKNLVENRQPIKDGFWLFKQPCRRMS